MAAVLLAGKKPEIYFCRRVGGWEEINVFRFGIVVRSRLKRRSDLEPAGKRVFISRDYLILYVKIDRHAGDFLDIIHRKIPKTDFLGADHKWQNKKNCGCQYDFLPH